MLQYFQSAVLEWLSPRKLLLFKQQITHRGLRTWTSVSYICMLVLIRLLAFTYFSKMAVEGIKEKNPRFFMLLAWWISSIHLIIFWKGSRKIKKVNEKKDGGRKPKRWYLKVLAHNYDGQVYLGCHRDLLNKCH